MSLSLLELKSGSNRILGSFPAEEQEVTDHVVTSHTGPDRVAMSYGDCTNGTTVMAVPNIDKPSVSVPIPKSYQFTSPVGWLPDGRLVLLARASACDGPGDVLFWMPGSASTQLFAQGVSDALLRFSS
jgi:hypothetical protein